MTLYTFPRGRQVSGSLQTENKIDNDSDINAALEKLRSDKSKTVRGGMTVLPVMNTIVYIEPIYTVSPTQGALPELKYVIAVCGDTVVMEPSLAETMKKLAQLAPTVEYEEPQTAAAPENDLTEEMSARLAEAIAKYREAQQFSKEGDWVNYGKSMKDFEDDLNRIEYSLQYGDGNAQQTEESAPESAPSPTAGA